MRWLDVITDTMDMSLSGFQLKWAPNPGKGFPGGSAGKESACNAGDLGLIPGLGRSPGEGNGYLLQYSGLECQLPNVSVQFSSVAQSCPTLCDPMNYI